MFLGVMGVKVRSNRGVEDKRSDGVFADGANSHVGTVFAAGGTAEQVVLASGINFGHG